MEQLADKGNGNYAYIGTQAEARRVFQDKLLTCLADSDLLWLVLPVR